MRYAKAWYYFSIGTGIALLLVIVFYFFIEAYGDGLGAGLLALFLAICNLVSLIYTSKAGHHKVAFGQGLILLLFVISIFFSVSRTILFGRKVDRIYLGEDAGFQELIFYSRGVCVVHYGGIGGVREINYCSYLMKDTAIYVPAGWNPFGPTEEVKIDGKMYNVLNSAQLSGVINHE